MKPIKHLRGICAICPKPKNLTIGSPRKGPKREFDGLILELGAARKENPKGLTGLQKKCHSLTTPQRSVPQNLICLGILTVGQFPTIVASPK